MKTTSRHLLLLVLLFFGSGPVRAQQPAAPASSDPGDAQAQAYYHFTLGRLYEEMAGDYPRSEFLRRAIDEYKEALKSDPDASEVLVRLAEVYRRAGRIRDAVQEAKQLLQANPDNLAAHRLLGRIYFQTLGEMESGGSSQQTLPLAIEEYEQITRLAPDDTDALLDLARLYRLANNLPKAEEALRKLLAVEPQSETGLAALASIYNESGESEKAIQLLQGATAGTPSSRLLASLAEAYQQAGDEYKAFGDVKKRAASYENAIAAYRRALEQDPENAEHRRRLADVLLRAERPEEALAEFQSVLKADPGDAESLLRVAQIYLFQRRFDDAQLTLDKARAIAPDNLDIGFNQARLHEARGQFDAAIAVLTDMAARMTRTTGQYSSEEKRERSLVVEHLGSLYRDTERFEEAVKTFEMMLALDEDSAKRGYGQIAETHRQARQLEPGLAVLRQGLERFPDDEDLKLEWASLTSDQGDLAKAVETVKSLMGGTPEDRRLYLSLAQMYERHKRFPDAEAAVAEAEKLSRAPSEVELVHFLRGALYERQKKYAEAETEFRKVLELNPKNALALNYLGYMLADQNLKLEESVALIKRALEVEPYNGAYLDSLGWAYYRLGQLDQAETHLLRAVARISRDATIQDHLGDLYFKMGRLDLAEKFWERARAEWQSTPRTEFDAEAFAKLEDKLRELKLRLAQEGRKPTGN